ncbi:MAG: D-glycero-beta-D-manno-heptose 1,7-bisphosphate 7-phosphatase, partial [Methylococcales bacterium]
PIPGSLEAIAELSQNGYRVVVITNQSGISRGLLDLESLAAIHAKMHRRVERLGGKIESVYFCPHGPHENCDCRKPKPGLLHRFARDYQVELRNIPFIGDSFRDIQAAWQAGASPVLVKTGKGLRTLKTHPELNLPLFENLYDAVQSILSRQ